MEQVKNLQQNTSKEEVIIQKFITQVKDIFRGSIKFNDFKYDTSLTETKLIGTNSLKMVVIDITLSVKDNQVVGYVYDSVLYKAHKKYLTKEISKDDIFKIIKQINKLLLLGVKDIQKVLKLDRERDKSMEKIIKDKIVKEEKQNINLLSLPDIKDIVCSITNNPDHKGLKLNVYEVKHGIVITDRMNIIKSVETNLNYTIGLDYLGYNNLTYIYFNKKDDLIIKANKFDIYKKGSSIFISNKANDNNKSIVENVEISKLLEAI